MNIKSLETFFWIAKLGSFRATAKKLYASQPTISARIAGLENQLGIELFDRSGRKAVLTAKGRQVLSYAEQILQLHADLLETVASPDAIQGTIRLGVAETIAYTWLPELIERINETYPAINLELDVDISINLSEKLLKREIDIAFLIGEVKQEGFFNMPFYSYSLIWVVSPKLTLPPEPVSLSELAKIPIITYPRMSEPHTNIRTLINKMGSSTQIHSSSSLSTIIRMALDGIGVSALPKEIITRELATGQLREFKVEASIPDLVFNMAYCAAPGANVVRAVADLSRKIVASKPL
ncbi:LysR family transcriptional regulator [Marinobacter sp. M3C]|jgi:DNA-binding transcriptional LysR family regulator|uniref:LysR family transcriptional regulator n=1 Tax=unclassified Marinobacter TaxID=83889 RepID=UPI002010B392|nr:MULTISPECIES: LysR family transcriptional regulator [unclassified Marinobacter]MCL1479813.1 LysR family transcriptional regulator [Marinobacter sp.]MCL1486446.1 LysR family transcriptional regulator [Marinobacter sp.]UQG56008.1 LysR family transcriptional regulator [Marinobacter sp. M4C]UQG58635.1 LysR family transcriptional regulator [Marinobacter sp. M3C]UQG64813.1 LysR family transcriptional regulator [Marinobacter sp. M2C]